MTVQGSSEQFSEFDSTQVPNEVGTEALQFAPHVSPFFGVEVAAAGGDLIFHFYLPADMPRLYRELRVPPQAILRAQEEYWADIFPGVLDAVARDTFKAEHPRLTAMRVEDKNKETEFDGVIIPLDSWWLRARGFVQVLPDIEGLIAKFYRGLEDGLRNRNFT